MAKKPIPPSMFDGMITGSEKGSVYELLAELYANIYLYSSSLMELT
jgi:hypothetical protein